MSSLPYLLPDHKLIEQCLIRQAEFLPQLQDEHYAMQYIPSATYAVLGASNKPDTSLFVDVCREDNVMITQRPSGGEAVLVSPLMSVFSHALISSALPRSLDFFMQNLEFVQKTLQSLGVEELKFDGISDLCIGDKKILGCAIYRRQNMILFQSVLNIAEAPAHIGKYLKTPQRMPDYRKGRDHADFITSLSKAGYAIDAKQIDVVRQMRNQGIEVIEIQAKKAP